MGSSINYSRPHHRVLSKASGQVEGVAPEQGLGSNTEEQAQFLDAFRARVFVSKVGEERRGEGPPLRELGNVLAPIILVD